MTKLDRLLATGEPTTLMSESVVVVDGQSGSVPLRGGTSAQTRTVTLVSERYPSPTSKIRDLDWIGVVDVARSGVGVTFEYDEERKSLYILLGENAQIGAAKRRRRLSRDSILTHWKWAKRVIFGHWDRDLERWNEEDRAGDGQEAREALAGAPGQMGGGSRQEEDGRLRVEFEAGRKVDYLNLWRERAHKWFRVLEFSCLVAPIVVIGVFSLAPYVVVPVSLAFVAVAWWADGVKSKNRKRKARWG